MTFLFSRKCIPRRSSPPLVILIIQTTLGKKLKDFRGRCFRMSSVWQKHDMLANSALVKFPHPMVFPTRVVHVRLLRSSFAACHWQPRQYRPSRYGCNSFGRFGRTCIVDEKMLHPRVELFFRFGFQSMNDCVFLLREVGVL